MQGLPSTSTNRLEEEWGRVQAAISDPDGAIQEMEESMVRCNQAIRNYLLVKKHSNNSNGPNYFVASQLLSSLDVLLRQWP